MNRLNWFLFLVIFFTSSCSEKDDCSIVFVNKGSLSMSPTIKGAARVCVNGNMPFQDLNRYDLILIKSPTPQFSHVRMVRRVVALAGEEIKIGQHGISVNGSILDLPDVIKRSLEGGENKALRKAIFFEGKVPEGQIFVLGDNIYRAIDSTEFGPLDQGNYLGKVLRIDAD